LQIFRPSICMITFQNKKSFAFDHVRLADKSISTLLIPAHLLDKLKEKSKINGNSLVAYLKILLRNFRTFTHSGLIPPPLKIKTEYQDVGLNLHRLNFRVSNADWLELGELALAFGKSRCWLFVFLLELDIAGLWEILSESGLDLAVPTTARLRLRVSLSLRRVSQDFARSYHVRV